MWGRRGEVLKCFSAGWHESLCWLETIKQKKQGYLGVKDIFLHFVLLPIFCGLHGRCIVLVNISMHSVWCFFFIWSNVIAFLLIWGNNNNFLSAARFQSLTHQWATSKMGLQIRIRELNTTSQVLNAEIANRHNLSHYAWMFGKRTCQKYSYSLFLAWLLNCTNQLDVPLEGYSKSQNWTEASISFHDANLKRYKKSAMGYSQIQLPCEKSLLTSNRATRGQWVFYSSWMMLEGKNNGGKKKKKEQG